MFTYNCDQLGWIGEMNNYASVGFNVLGSAEDFQGFNNHNLSRTPNVSMVACNHTQLNVPWTNVIYRVGVSVSEEQLNRSRCLARVAQDELRYSVSTDFLLENPPARLTDCPCSLFQVERDHRFFADDDMNSPADMVCYFSRFPFAYSDESTIKLFHRCCYSSRWLIVI